MIRIRTGLAAALLLGLGATSFGALAQDGGTPQRGGTAILALAADPITLNPDVSTNVPDRVIGCVVYQGLLEISDDYKVLPLLAKSWTVSSDHLTYTFELNHAKWHDGQPFTSDDVKYTLLEVSAKYSSIFAGAARAIDSIDASVPDRVVIKLKHTYGPFLFALGCIQGAAILPAHLFRGTDPLKNPATTSLPVGTGAFKFAEWHRGDYIRLMRNPDYYQPGLPYLDQLIGKVINQSTSRTQALEAGEIDFVRSLAASDKATVAANPKLKVEVDDAAPETSLAFINTKHKPLDDKRVRQALFMATDRDFLFKHVFFGVGAVGTMPFSTEINWAANPAIDYRKIYPYDPAKAKALLDAAGVKPDASGKRFDVRIVISATQFPEFQQVAVALKSMWQPLGVDVRIIPLEDATLAKRVFVDGDYDVYLGTYTSYSDPAFGVARTFMTSTIGKVYGNPTGYSNPVVDKLFAEGEAATTLEARGKFYQHVQAILADDLPVLTLRQYKEIDGASKQLYGLLGWAQGNGHWSTAWIAK
jgi:peptide/nickel transport system substrate-binding protein